MDRLNNKVHLKHLGCLRSSKEDNVAGSKWTKLRSGRGGEGCEGDNTCRTSSEDLDLSGLPL